ncbi:unnamed protein product [Polarella glacialis]|uniref:Uncharacterized protein n=1 Tax=Polarella glacialis TaxID=89957 RepID=A0A813GFK4_POLGL|nr:unnamed protein product [Polarella glacialis]
MGGRSSRQPAAAPRIVAAGATSESVAAASLKVAPPDVGFASWTAKRKDLPVLAASWAEHVPADQKDADARRCALLEVASMEVPKGWAVWALADDSELRSGGFYLQAPTDAQVLVLLETGEVNVVRRLVVAPGVPLSVANTVVRAWLYSMTPKRYEVACPEDFHVFGLQVER